MVYFDKEREIRKMKDPTHFSNRARLIFSRISGIHVSKLRVAKS